MGEIRQLLQKIWERYTSIDFVYLFGSWVDSDSSIKRDIDLGVFASLPPVGRTEWKVNLIGDICQSLGTDAVDLILMSESDNIMLLDEVVRKGVVIFERHPDKRKLFDVKVWHDAIDFKQQRQRWIGV